MTTASATQPVWCRWMPKNKRIYVCIIVYSMCIADSMSAHNIQEFSARLHGSRKGITNVKREEELPTWCQENWVDDFMDYSCIHGGVSSLKCISLSVHSTASVLKEQRATVSTAAWKLHIPLIRLYSRLFNSMNYWEERQKKILATPTKANIRLIPEYKWFSRPLEA